MTSHSDVAAAHRAALRCEYHAPEKPSVFARETTPQRHCRTKCNGIVFDGTLWPYPTRPTLGAALLQSGDAAKAEQIFRDDLKRNPRNGWGLRGLEQSLRTQGKTQNADLVRDEFEQAWKHADVQLDLKWF